MHQVEKMFIKVCLRQRYQSCSRPRLYRSPYHPLSHAVSTMNHPRYVTRGGHAVDRDSDSTCSNSPSSEGEEAVTGYLDRPMKTDEEEDRSEEEELENSNP